MGGEQAVRTVLRLTPIAGDPGRFELPTVGTLRAGGWFRRRDAGFTAGGTTWSCVGRGVPPFRRFEARDRLGVICGRASMGPLGRVRRLDWDGQPYRLAVQGLGTRRNFLERNGEDLYEISPTGYAPQPVKVVVLGGEPAPAGLVLFVTWIVRRYDRGTSAANGGDGGAWIGVSA